MDNKDLDSAQEWYSWRVHGVLFRYGTVISKRNVVIVIRVRSRKIKRPTPFPRRVIGVEILAVLLQGLVVLLRWELEEHQAALPRQHRCSNFH
jgi:hypothetical protein